MQAIRAAPPSLAEAAVGALGTGLSGSEEVDHPFPAALRALAAKPGDLGGFARALEPRLEQARRAGDTVRAAPTLIPAAAGDGAVPARTR